jgi:peptidoglycan/LPS O-acetylase OafA/YrhL
MRGVAALLVAFFHLRYGIVGVPLLDYYIFSFRFGGRGYLWVDFFFILSGFILAYRYGNACSKLNPRIYGHFIWRRFARIWPLHVATMVAALLYLGIRNGWRYLSISAIIANLLLVHGWGRYFHPPLNFPSWSLSGEWGAYLVLPLYLFTIGRIRRGLIHVTLVIGLYAVLIWYAALFGHGTLDRLREQWGLGRCLIEVGIGVSLFQLHELFTAGKATRLARITPAVARMSDAAAAVIFVAIFVVFTYTAWDLYFVPLAAALIFCLSLAEGPFSALLHWRPMVLLGEISFSIYMLHGFVFWLCQDVPASFKGRVGFWTGALWLLGAHLLVVGLAYLSYKLIERPADRALRTRWFCRRPVSVGLRQRVV